LKSPIGYGQAPQYRPIWLQLRTFFGFSEAAVDGSSCGNGSTSRWARLFLLLFRSLTKNGLVALQNWSPAASRKKKRRPNRIALTTTCNRPMVTADLPDQNGSSGPKFINKSIRCIQIICQCQQQVQSKSPEVIKWPAVAQTDPADPVFVPKTGKEGKRRRLRSDSRRGIGRRRITTRSGRTTF
jgi:hypothetical protein